MALWGQIIKPNNKLKYEVPDEASLVINQAVLPKECKGNVSVWIGGFVDEEGTIPPPICIAQLNWQNIPQVNFEVLIPNGDNVEIEVRGESEVHLLGYFSPIEIDSDEEDEEDGEEDSEDLVRMLYGLEDVDADSDMDSDDDDDEDGDAKSPRIQELSSSDDEDAKPSKVKAIEAAQPPAKKQKTGDNTSKPTAAAPKQQQPQQKPQQQQQQKPQQQQQQQSPGSDGKKKRKRNKKGGDKQ